MGTAGRRRLTLRTMTQWPDQLQPGPGAGTTSHEGVTLMSPLPYASKVTKRGHRPRNYQFGRWSWGTNDTEATTGHDPVLVLSTRFPHSLVLSKPSRHLPAFSKKVSSPINWRPLTGQEIKPVQSNEFFGILHCYVARGGLKSTFRYYHSHLQESMSCCFLDILTLENETYK